MKNIRKYGLWVGLAAVCAAALIFVAVQYRSERDQARAVVEEGYQQRLYEAQEHLQAIGLKLTKAGVASEQSTLAELFSGVSRQAESVLAGLSALPLSHQAMSDTLKFCNQLAEYASQLCLQMAQGEALTVDQLTLLENLRGQCVQLTSQIALAQDAMVQESLRMAVNGSVFYEEPSAEDRPLEGVAEPDNGMEYPTMIYDGAFSDARRFGEPKALGTEVIDGAKAIELAKSYVGEQRVKSAVSGAETAGALASYGVVLTLNDGTVLNCEVTKKGGRLLWMVPEHASFPQSLTAEECIRRGQAFLSAHGYGEMEQNHYQIYDGLAVINFVALQDGVLLYPHGAFAIPDRSAGPAAGGRKAGSEERAPVRHSLPGRGTALLRADRPAGRTGIPGLSGRKHRRRTGDPAHGADGRGNAECVTEAFRGKV